MRIWIDGYEANVPQRLGSSQVAFELLKNLEMMDDKNEYTIFLPGPVLDDLPKPRENWKYEILRPRRLWTRIALPLKIFRSIKKPDIFFSPTQYLPSYSPVKKIVTIFDLSPERFPKMFLKKDLYKLRNWTKKSVNSAEHIITISESSKNDLERFYNVPSKKISVCYPGYNSKLFNQIKDVKEIDKIKEKYGVKDRYVIFIGTVQPRKNLLKLIEAFKDIESVKLVVAGKIKGVGRQAWMFEEILNKPKDLGIEDRVIFTDFVPDQDLPYLVNGAVAFVLPSLWEGFGIPVVDSMACGVPVIVSKVSSLPEVVGDAGLLIDPEDVKSIQGAIKKISTDDNLHKKLSEKGLEQAKKFSWEKMAREILEVFEKVGEK